VLGRKFPRKFLVGRLGGSQQVDRKCGYRAATPVLARKVADGRLFRAQGGAGRSYGKQGCGWVGKGAIPGPIHALTWGVGSQSGGVVGTVAETAG
jgi:hypothetical protein